jgi:hypothetical protein
MVEQASYPIDGGKVLYSSGCVVVVSLFLSFLMELGFVVGDRLEEEVSFQKNGVILDVMLSKMRLQYFHSSV